MEGKTFYYIVLGIGYVVYYAYKAYNEQQQKQPTTTQRSDSPTASSPTISKTIDEILQEARQAYEGKPQLESKVSVKPFIPKKLVSDADNSS